VLVILGGGCLRLRHTQVGTSTLYFEHLKVGCLWTLQMEFSFNVSFVHINGCFTNYHFILFELRKLVAKLFVTIHILQSFNIVQELYVIVHMLQSFSIVQKLFVIIHMVRSFGMLSCLWLFTSSVQRFNIDIANGYPTWIRVYLSRFLL
jgi:hypothetical protein